MIRRASNRFLQWVALYAPGATGLRVMLHRWRGVKIGAGTFISVGAIIETERPELVSIGSNVTIGIRAVLIGHFREENWPEKPTVIIEDDAFVGPGAIILPHVRIGRGAVVTAGTVVARSVPPATMVRGNPATAVAMCGVPLGVTTLYADFVRHLRPVPKAGP